MSILLVNVSVRTETGEVTVTEIPVAINVPNTPAPIGSLADYSTLDLIAEIQRRMLLGGEPMLEPRGDDGEIPF